MHGSLDLTPPPVVGLKDANGYNAYRRNAKGALIRQWIARIENDRNWGRAIMQLPLIEPVDPAILAWCRRLGSRSILLPTQPRQP